LGSRTGPTTAPDHCSMPANPTGHSSTSTHAEIRSTGFVSRTRHGNAVRSRTSTDNSGFGFHAESTSARSAKPTPITLPQSSTGNADADSTIRAPPISTIPSPCSDHWNWPTLPGVTHRLGWPVWSQPPRDPRRMPTYFASLFSSIRRHLNPGSIHRSPPKERSKRSLSLPSATSLDRWTSSRRL
jgi:hypothetical protein